MRPGHHPAQARNGVRLTVLGSGTAAPNPRRGASGYLVEIGDERVLLECGAGTIDRMLRYGHDPRRLDHVILSHHHLDHFGEIGHLLFASRLPGQGRDGPLTLAGSRPLLRIFQRYREPFGSWLAPREYPLILHDLDEAPLQGKGYTVSAHPVSHIDSSRALRLSAEDGTVLTYSGDTDVCGGVVEAAREADLFVVECSFPEGSKQPGHLVPSEAAALARQAGVRRLLLSHFYPECDADEAVRVAKQGFSGEVRAAEDGLRVDVAAAPGPRAES